MPIIRSHIAEAGLLTDEQGNISSRSTVGMNLPSR